ncbi:hypothetical protein [Vreelandella venusta]|uniref:hypothetical protein n=1 Tax=Vreelandella venusta TaxID=44935 RepID=UPI00201028D2|nr:hypothetical protein [Halomonas venusta]UQI42526.1 hypothetical protein M3L73_09780 [Halomonas venusta]
MKTDNFSPLIGGTEFGFYPNPLEIETHRFSITTKPSLSETVQELASHEHTVQGWIYSGPAINYDLIKGKKAMPYPARLFGLPQTHTLTLYGEQDESRIDFVLWCLSFLLGMRLTSKPMAYLDATPVQPGKLNDFAMTMDERDEAINRFVDFHDKSTDQITLKRVTAAIHALFIAQNPKNLPFERFQYYYMALDTCYRLTKDMASQKPPKSHALRVQWTCDYFEIPTPWWAQENSTKDGTALSGIRNDTIHEGLFFGEPLGFARYGGNDPTQKDKTVTMEMRGIVCRLLIAILGMPEARYVKSEVGRYTTGLDLLTKPS